MQDQVRCQKRTASMGNGRKTFFHHVFFEVHFAWSAKLAELQQRLPCQKWAEKEKGEVTEITVNQTAVTFHTDEFKSKGSHRSIVPDEGARRFYYFRSGIFWGGC